VFHLPAFIRSFSILLVLFGVLFVATKLSTQIKTKVSNVLGTKVTESSQKVPENLQKDITTSLEDIKKQGMKTDVQDVVDAGSKVNKVITDYHTFQKEVEKQINEFFKKKEK